MFASLEIDWTAYQPYLPYAVGCLVAVGVFLFVGRRYLKQPRSSRRHDLRPAPADEHGDKAFGDRRVALRREGKPVPVQLSSPAFHGETRPGWVLDRSTGGLRVTLDSPIAPGTALQLLADNAPDTTPWVTAIVRSCKPIDDRFELGCEFETTPPWNVLLLFG